MQAKENKTNETIINYVAPYKLIRGSEQAAGLDLQSVEDCIIKPKSFECISVGLRIELPKGSFGLICPRSGLGSKGIIPMSGVIDSDYTGVIKVVLFNHSNTIFKINKGDRIAQLIVLPLVAFQLNQTYNIQSQTMRGNAGFGSTGLTMHDYFVQSELRYNQL